MNLNASICHAHINDCVHQADCYTFHSQLCASSISHLPWNTTWRKGLCTTAFYRTWFQVVWWKWMFSPNLIIINVLPWCLWTMATVLYLYCLSDSVCNVSSIFFYCQTPSFRQEANAQYCFQAYLLKRKKKKKQKSWAPRNWRIMLRWFSSASWRIFSAGSIFQRHSVPTGFVWCLWYENTTSAVSEG